LTHTHRIHMAPNIATQFPANCRWQTPLRTLVSHLKVLVRLSHASAGGEIRMAMVRGSDGPATEAPGKSKIFTSPLSYPEWSSPATTKMEKPWPKDPKDTSPFLPDLRWFQHILHHFTVVAQFFWEPTSEISTHLPSSAVLPQCSAPRRCRSSQRPRSNNPLGSRPRPAPVTTPDPLCAGPRPGDTGLFTSFHRPSWKL